MLTLKTIGEFGLIDFIKKGLKVSSRVLQGIGDDAAVVEISKDKMLLLTTDMLLEDAHFTRGTAAVKIGHKALACNISDIAAMGGKPLYALVSLGLPTSLSVDFVKNIYRGMAKLTKEFGISIVGGDTNKSHKTIINVALIGEVRKENIVLRSGAKIGDQIFVTGPLGKSFSTQWHLQFIPRLKEAQYLVNHFKPTAMIDVSDGLAADVGHILKASKTGAVLDETKIPRRREASLEEALSDGEDFELAFTLSPKTAKRFLKVSHPFQFYWIGEMTQGQLLQLRNKRGECRPFLKKGFVHF